MHSARSDVPLPAASRANRPTAVTELGSPASAIPFNKRLNLQQIDPKPDSAVPSPMKLSTVHGGIWALEEDKQGLGARFPRGRPLQAPHFKLKVKLEAPQASRSLVPLALPLAAEPRGAPHCHVYNASKNLPSLPVAVTKHSTMRQLLGRKRAGCCGQARSWKRAHKA